MKYRKIGKMIKDPIVLMKFNAVWDSVTERHTGMAWIKCYSFKTVMKHLEEGRYYEPKSGFESKAQKDKEHSKRQEAIIELIKFKR
jgi:hypothetical protein